MWASSAGTWSPNSRGAFWWAWARTEKALVEFEPHAAAIFRQNADLSTVVFGKSQADLEFSHDPPRSFRSSSRELGSGVASRASKSRRCPSAAATRMSVATWPRPLRSSRAMVATPSPLRVARCFCDQFCLERAVRIRSASIRSTSPGERRMLSIISDRFWSLWRYKTISNDRRTRASPRGSSELLTQLR